MNIPTLGDFINGPGGEKSLELVELLGFGAFGVVFKAIETATAKNFAVKFPQAAVVGSNELAAFLNEVQAAGEIEHPNVVRVVYVEIGTGDLPPFLVMEFLKDGTLQSYLDKIKASGLTVDKELLRKWSSALVEGMAAINSKMLHRDIKPDNILMDGDSPKIGDFGLSKIVGAITRSQTFKGGQHMYYMAPEAWKMETNDIQVDMYAIGIVLFQIASLQFPYDIPSDPNASPDAFMRMHLLQQPKSLKALRPDLPTGFSHIISRLMEKRPQDRFPDWEEVKKALARVWKPDNATNSQLDGMIGSLVDTMGLRHETYTKQQLEEERLAIEKREREQLDRFQKDSLVRTLMEVVSEFNEQSSLVKITAREDKGTGRAFFTLPDGAGVIKLSFLSLDPPLNLKRGSVGFAAVVHDPVEPRLNFLLCRRSASDLYGEWLACEVNFVPVRRHRIRREYEPFGFEDEQELREIEVSDRAMHIYTFKLRDDIKIAFLEVIHNSIHMK